MGTRGRIKPGLSIPSHNSKTEMLCLRRCSCHSLGNQTLLQTNQQPSHSRIHPRAALSNRDNNPQRKMFQYPRRTSLVSKRGETPQILSAAEELPGVSRQKRQREECKYCTFQRLDLKYGKHEAPKASLFLQQAIYNNNYPFYS